MVTRVTTRPYVVNSQKLIRLPGVFGQAEDDHVRRRPDRGGVATQIGWTRQS
jgi:hypothetical protein